MNNPVPLEYVSSFAQTNQALMLHLATSVDEKTRRRLRFFARQILDALSPSNYLATNPQSLRRVMETGGESLATGIKFARSLPSSTCRGSMPSLEHGASISPPRATEVDISYCTVQKLSL
jgi:hypothetical protein